MTYRYVGSELDLFAEAHAWKAYVRRHVSPYLGRHVLEVGAGTGGTTRVLCRGEPARWLCLEPDRGLAQRLQSAIASGALPACCEARVGTLTDLNECGGFDSVLYMDVLEHIEDDRAELARAERQLRPGGRLIVLAPAHQWLFSPFDESIGHYRRYTRHTLQDAAPEGLALERLVYLDAVGLLASLGNRMVLRSPMPNPRQIAVWDRLMVPLSRLIDPLVGHTIGKSVLGIWTKA